MPEFYGQTYITIIASFLTLQKVKTKTFVTIDNTDWFLILILMSKTKTRKGQPKTISSFLFHDKCVSAGI